MYNTVHPDKPVLVSGDSTPANNPEWNAILDRLLREREQLNGLSDESKLALGGQENFQGFPQHYQQLLRIARKLNQLRPEQLASAQHLRNNDIYTPGGLDAYERYVEQLSKNPRTSPASPEATHPETIPQPNYTQQLSRLPKDIQSLLGGEQIFQQDRTQPQLLRIGQKLQQLQQLSPKAFQIYQPVANELVGSPDLFERSTDVYLTTIGQLRAQGQTSAGGTLGQGLDALLGKDPTVGHSDYWQIVKDLVASVLTSPKYAGEVLGDLWLELKEHWVEFISLTVVLIFAQGTAAILAGAPEPTMLTKVVAVALESFILLVYGVGIVVSAEIALGELVNWWTLATHAKGDPNKIEEASKAFLRVLLNLLFLILNSKAFQSQLNSKKLTALRDVLRRQRQRPISLPENYPGATLEMVRDPNNPTRFIYDVQSEVLAKGRTADRNHELSILRDGRIIRCSVCRSLQTRYGHLLNEPNRNFQMRIRNIEELAANAAREAARNLANPEIAAQQARAMEMVRELEQELQQLETQSYNHLSNRESLSPSEWEKLRLIRQARTPYIRADELELRRSQVIAQCGEELVLRAETNLRSLLNTADIFIRIKESRLEAMLRDGRYKTIFETEATEAEQDPTGYTYQAIERRRNGEERLFGYSQNLSPENRPLYGYVAREADSPEAGIVALGYGKIAIKLRTETKSRATFTADDSLFMTEGTDRMTRQPSMFEYPNISSFLSLEDIVNSGELLQKVQRIATATDLEELSTIKQQHFYFEVQIHGGVTINDIAEIIYIGEQPSATITQLVREKGIVILVK